MKILVTNDDGIQSEGLAIVVRWATKLGEVTVAAPKTQQSGKSHAIAIHTPIAIAKVQLGLGETAAYAVDSTPVDCVRFATIGLKEHYDLILSGINRGYNLGEDILYSGTVGAVFEAQLQKTRGLALSTDFDTFEHAQAALDSIWNYLLTHRLFDKNLAYNVNVPPKPQGIVETKQGGAYYSDEWVLLSDGMWVQEEYSLWQQNGYCVHQNVHDHSLDTDATIDGYITVTALTTDRSIKLN